MDSNAKTSAVCTYVGVSRGLDPTEILFASLFHLYCIFTCSTIEPTFSLLVPTYCIVVHFCVCLQKLPIYNYLCLVGHTIILVRQILVNIFTNFYLFNVGKYFTM